MDNTLSFVFEQVDANSVLQSHNNLFPATATTTTSNGGDGGNVLRSSLVRNPLDNDGRFFNDTFHTTNDIGGEDLFTNYLSFDNDEPLFESSIAINDINTSSINNNHNWSHSPNKSQDNQQILFKEGGEEEEEMAVVAESKDQYDTVCVKNSPSHNEQETAPWEKSELRDLFSPLKLESIFTNNTSNSPTKHVDLKGKGKFTQRMSEPPPLFNQDESGEKIGNEPLDEVKITFEHVGNYIRSKSKSPRKASAHYRLRQPPRKNNPIKSINEDTQPQQQQHEDTNGGVWKEESRLKERRSVQLFQLHYDTATRDRLNALVSELDKVDYAAIPSIEDNLGVDVSVKRLKLSEQSLIVEEGEVEKVKEDDQGDILSSVVDQSTVIRDWNLSGRSLDAEIEAFKREEEELNNCHTKREPFVKPEWEQGYQVEPTPQRPPIFQMVSRPKKEEPEKSLGKIEAAIESLCIANNQPSTTTIRVDDESDTSSSTFEETTLNREEWKNVVKTCPASENLHHLTIEPSDIQSIYGLSKSFGHLKSLKIDGNLIQILAGAPVSLLNLSARFNLLSNLTTFSHLEHLQFVDVSNNRLESLLGFSGLVHLQELIIDCNQIRDLEGINSMPSLRLLSARRNTIATIDGLESMTLERLNVDENQLQEIGDVSKLPRLKWLSLAGNSLSDTKLVEPCLSIEYLNLSNNLLTEFDAAFFPRVETLNINGNLLEDDAVMVSNARHQIKFFSCANQKTQSQRLNLDFHQLKQVYSLDISHNILCSADCLLPFSRLESLSLNGCHLKALPGKFSRKLCNLRFLDLSNNMLTDIQPLKRLKYLQSLNLFGNELKSLACCLEVLISLGHIVDFDLRMNPITAKFYHSTVDHDSLGDEENHRLDMKHCATLNDLTFIRRVCYRTTLINEMGPDLIRLDGILVNDEERQRAKAQYDKLRHRMYQLRPQIDQQPQEEKYDFIAEKEEEEKDEIVEEKRNGVTFWVPVQKSKIVGVENRCKKSLVPKKEIFKKKNVLVSKTKSPAVSTYLTYSENGKPMKIIRDLR